MIEMSSTSKALAARDVARLAAEQLAEAFESSGEVFIRTPLLYRGGTYVAVHVTGQNDRFFVSDYGFGAMEADQIGAGRQYSRCAPPVAARSGLVFDDRSFFVVEVRRDQVAGAAAAVANASKEAVDLAAQHLAERRERENADQLVDRLTRMFTAGCVHRDAEVRGASSHRWQPTALVEAEAGRIAFDFVKTNAQSVYQSVAMFHDLSHLTGGPERVAVAEDLERLGDFLGVLSQAAHVVDLRAPDEAYRRFAA